MVKINYKSRIFQQAMFNYQRVSMFHSNTFFVGVRDPDHFETPDKDHFETQTDKDHFETQTPRIRIILKHIQDTAV